MESKLDNAIIRQLEPPGLALYFRRILTTNSEAAVSAHLLEAVKYGSVTPMIFCIWLAIAKFPSSLSDALKQEHSLIVRRVAIKQFGKELKGSRWRITLDGLGGTPGLLSLIAQFSVAEVQLFVKTVARYVKGVEVDEKRERVEELLRGLLPRLFPDMPHKSPDGRPLTSHYAYLTLCSTSEFLTSALRTKSFPPLQWLPTSLALKYRSELLRQLSLNKIFEKDSSQFDLSDCLSDLLGRSPSYPSPEPGFSESMLFSLELLRKLARDNSAKFPKRMFMSRLVEPLLRRAVKKKLDWTSIQEIIDLTIRYLRVYPNETANISFSSGGFLHSLVRCWSARESLFQKQLVEALELIPKSQASISNYAGILLVLRRSLRYKFLRLCFLYVSIHKRDIDIDEGLNDLRVGQWPCNIFTRLEPGHALNLLRRLRRVKNDHNFLTLDHSYSDYSILHQPPSPGLKYGDFDLLQIFLGQGDAEALDRAKNTVEERKRKAVISREQTDRAFFAKSALFYAIASGSLQLYSETLVWVRRFVRDPLAIKILYAKDATHTHEGINLLSGTQEVFPLISDSALVYSRVLEGNKTLLTLFETACSAIREPSFYHLDWSPILELFRIVVLARLQRSSTLKRSLILSDDELYEILWPDTIELLIGVEKAALKPGHEALSFDSPQGPLSYNYFNSHSSLGDPLPASFRFFDNLAKARDALWRKFRPSIFPVAATLPSPWPLGLPIQFMTHLFNLAVESAGNHTPFIASRAAAIVFAEARIALSPAPEDKETKDAIGVFVDSFRVSLEIYVLQSPPQERSERMKRAWSHAMESFSIGRMEPNEAYRTWVYYFQQALPSFLMPPPESEIIPPYPILPEDADTLEPSEWDPAFKQPPSIASRNLTLTCLDYLLMAPTNISKATQGFSILGSTTQGRNLPGVWSYQMPWRSQEVREGQVLSALLFLDSRKGGHRRLLSTPFPSQSDVRYPCLFLAPEFLCRPELNPSNARGILAHLLNTVPPPLLADLTNATLDTLLKIPPESSGAIELEGIAYGLLILLTKSDCPHLASDPVLRIIIEKPESSSWHRRFLTVTFLRRLSAAQSRGLLQSFASAVRMKLEEQAEARKTKPAEGPTEGPQSTSSKPYIKVTTVKYLAQLLDGADFVSESFSVDVLCGLFQSSSHLDIRAAVIESMLGMLGKCSDEFSDPLAEQLMSSFETTMPILGSINERRPLTEEDWVEAERTEIPPEAYGDEDMKSLPPILSLLVHFVSNSSYPINRRKRFMESILLPLMDMLRANTARWIDIFLRKHKSTLKASDLPSIPFRTQLLVHLLQFCPTLTPASILDLYHQFSLANVRPQPDLAIFNKHVAEGSLEHRNSNEGRYWLSLFNNGRDAFDNGGFNLPSLLRRVWVPPVIPNGLQISRIQRVLFEQAYALLQAPTLSFTHWNRFVQRLEPSLHASDHDIPDKKAWLENTKPVIEDIINYIESMRTREWQRNSQRKPAILPTTFNLRLWLLCYPSQPSSKTAPEKCKDFAEQISVLVNKIAGGTRPCHEEFRLLKDAALKCPTRDCALVACYLGDLSRTRLSWLTAVDLLRVELADALFWAATPPDNDVTIRARETLTSWAINENEDARMRGMKLLARGIELFKGDG